MNEINPQNRQNQYSQEQYQQGQYQPVQQNQYYQQPQYNQQPPKKRKNQYIKMVVLDYNCNCCYCGNFLIRFKR